MSVGRPEAAVMTYPIASRSWRYLRRLFRAEEETL